MGKVLEVFATRIKELRDEQGLGVREAAAKMGISHSAILMYEKKKRTPDIEVCKLFADFYNVNGDHLMAALSYYCISLFVYFRLAGTDKISSKIGIFVSVCFFILYVLFILDSRTDWFAKIVFIAGAMSGIGFTPYCYHERKSFNPPEINNG